MTKPHLPWKMLRFGAVALCTVGMAAVPLGASGVTSSHAMAPFVNIGTQEAASSQTVSATAYNPAYRLRTCQVQNYPGRVGSCYDPYQMRTAYGIAPLIAAGYDGTGKSIDIIDAYNISTLNIDVNGFDSYYGLPGVPSSQSATPTFLHVYTPEGPVANNVSGWDGEMDLDVQWAHAIAPGATINLIEAKSANDVDLSNALKWALDHKLGDVASMSFGENESCLTKEDANRWDSVIKYAAVKGVTLFASAGDYGASQPTCDGNSWAKAVSSPANHPMVTAVGGTLLNAGAACFSPPPFNCNPGNYPYTFGQYIGETAWNENLSGQNIATGGGFSQIFGHPFFQDGVVSNPGRGLPDISYNAGVLTGVLVEFYGAQFYRFGGTSAGSPQWAAITAIIDQKAGTDLGVINPALYRLGNPSSASYCAACFHDVTTGNNSVTNLDANNNSVSITGFNAGTGWDATTGIGTPNAASLATALPGAIDSKDRQALVSNTAQMKFNNGRTQSAENRPH